MQVNLHDSRGNQFTHYTTDSVTINQETYHNNLIVTPNKIIPINWQSITELNLEQLPPLLELEPDLIIFGTGSQIQAPDARVLSQLQRQQIGFEVMAIPALCRTFNYLIGEGRQVIAVLLF